MFGRKRYDSLASSSADSDQPDHVSDVWEDFSLNGRDSDLDDTPPQMLPCAEQPHSFSGDFFNG